MAGEEKVRVVMMTVKGDHPLMDNVEDLIERLLIPYGIEVTDEIPDEEE